MKHIRLLALFLVLAMIAAACGGDDETGADETTAATQAAEETTAATEAPTTTEAPATTEAADTTEAAPEVGPLGAVTVDPGDPIEIRSLQALSGDAAFLGIPNDRATAMAVEDYGQIQGHDINIGTPLDDLCGPDGGQSAAQSIVADEQVIGVIGTSCSGAAQAASPLVSDAGMVMISPANTSPSLTSDLAGTPGENYHPGYYRTAHNDLFQGRAVAEFTFNELGMTTAAAIHDGDPYTQGLAQAFADAFEELGGTITVFTAVNPTDTDMVPLLTEVAQGSPEALFFPIFPQTGGPLIIQQVSQVEGLEDTQLISADGMLANTVLEIPESEGMYFSGPSLAFEDNANGVTGVTAEEFLQRYNDEFGEPPSAAFWAHSYDATTMLLQAIDNVAVDQGDGTLIIDRQALRDEIAATSGFQGMIGSLSCDEYGDCGSQQIQVFSHEDSSITDPTQLPVVYNFSGV